MRLSILVCSIADRMKDFSVIEDLCEQAARFDDVEVLYLGDNRRMSTGAKRNRLVGVASGEYVCFVDDDDTVADDYVCSIREATDLGADVICLSGSCWRDGVESGSFDCSLAHAAASHSYHDNRNYFLRMPNHLCATKRGLVAATEFKDVSFGEDSDFAKRLRPLLETETKIDSHLYHYHYGAKS